MSLYDRIKALCDENHLAAMPPRHQNTAFCPTFCPTFRTTNFIISNFK